MRSFGFSALGLVAAFTAGAQVTFTDNFNAVHDYLATGLAGTIWDGVYFGAGEFNNTGLGGGGPGITVQCDAAISAANALTIQSTGTAWERADDDGFFLFKVVRGDFSAVVRILTPFNNAGYNTAGLQARAFTTAGDPFGGTENYVSWTRFDEYGFANYLRNEVNGNVAQINPGDYPNSAYWLRLDRVGNTFRCYQRTNSADAWKLMSFPAPVNGTSLTRTDLAGQPLQVGLIHATFAGQLGVQFSSFSITESNLGPLAAVPGSAGALLMATNPAGNLALSWSPGAGSSGSLVVVWTGTNSVVKEMPANGFTYTGNPGYGQGSSLPATSYFVVYAGAGSNVTVTNILPGTRYSAAVFAYAGTGNSTVYSRSPATATLSVPSNRIYARAQVQGTDVQVAFAANPGKWYWLQYSDSLVPAGWLNAAPGPVLFTNLTMTLVHPGGATGPQRFYRIVEVQPEFALKLNNGAITTLQYSGDTFPTEYVSGGGRIGDVMVHYRQASDANWHTFESDAPAGVAAAAYATSPDGTQYRARYVITNSLGSPLVCESVFTFAPDTLHWDVNLTNQGGQAVVVGDLALPLPMNMAYSGATSSAMKHSFISGYGSFLFWMRPNSLGPYLLLTPSENTKLEYWDDPTPPLGYRAYIHSLVAGTNAAAQFPGVMTQGARWRQPNTSLTLAPEASQNYGFKFQWAADYDGIRQALVNEGKLDVHVVPGMTLPTNLFALVALRTTQTVSSVTAEFPAETQIQFLGMTNVSGSNYGLYQAQFSRLGENELTVTFGNGRTMYLEFFITEPLETLVKKRAAFLVSKQINDSSKWYNSLLCDWNMNDQVLLTPDNHDTLGNSFQVYEIASDDAGESRPAYLAGKQTVFPLQSEVSAMDNYIRNFVWGGLQRSTNETFAYGIYGVPDWHTLRTNNNLSLGRGYDYPHIFAMYYSMYQVAKYHPEVITALSAQEYLQRAWGTAMAMWSYGGGQATQVGLMNELVIPDIIDALVAESQASAAASLRAKWEQKVSYYVTGQADLFASEYAFDSTGFESQQAYAKYALEHAGTSLFMGSTNVSLFLQQVQTFARTQITANVFDRGWLETAYYYYGSDYRGDMGEDYVVTYMAQMGGWGLLDFALNFATNATDYLRLGYASYLNGWSTINSGTPASNYGFWYPGEANDGGCGGGFEPLAYNYTWLGGQPMHRGAWYYSAEQNLGFCGALRSAATILADDPIFGRLCYGGICQVSGGLNLVIPLDGVRKRFHALLSGATAHLELNSDRFAAGQNLNLSDDFSKIGFALESDNPSAHVETLRLTLSTGGQYTLSNNHGMVGSMNIVAGQQMTINLPVDAGAVAQSFLLSK